MVLSCLTEKLVQFKDAKAMIEANPANIRLKAESGTLTKNRVAEAERMVAAFESNIPEIKQLLEDFGRINGDERLAASKEAAQYAYETLERRIGFRTKQAILAREKAGAAANSATELLKAHNIPLIDGLNAIHHGDVGLAAKGYLPDSLSFNSRMRSYETLYGGQIADVMEELVPSFSFGKRSDEVGREFLRAYEKVVKGEKPAGRWGELAEKAEKWSMGQAADLERAGVDLKGKRGYLMGALTDVEKLRKTSQKDFVEFMMAREDAINWKTVNDLAPGIADTKDQRIELFKHFYDVKVSNGAIKLGDFPVFRNRGVSSVVNSRGEHRLIQFTTGDAAHDYVTTFGHGGVFESLMYMNNRSARHLALTETYGPQPGATIREVKNALYKEHGLDALPAIDEMLANVREASKVDYKDIVSPKMKAVFGGVTNGFRASVLGSAFIPSYFGDAANVAVAKSMRGLPWFNDLMKSFGKIFDPSLNHDASELAHMGYSISQFHDAMMNSDRAPHLNWAERAAKKTLSGVMKISLLERQTTAQKVVNIASAGKVLADFAEGREVSPTLMNYLKSAKLDTPEAKAMLQSAVRDQGFAGGSFKLIDLTHLFESGDKSKMELATRLSSLIEDVAEIAAPVSSSKAAQFWGQAAGSSTLGYIGTKLAQPLTSYMTSHWQNVLKPLLQQEGMNRVKLLGAYTIMNFITGAMLVQIQRLLTGKEPLPVGLELAGRAGAQFALGPLMGTLLNLGTSGPVIEDQLALLRAAKTMAALPVKAAKAAITGKKDKSLGKDSVAAIKYLTPGQNLWYTKLLADRYLFDQLEKSVDGAEFSKRVAKRIAIEKKKGSGFYWKPGDI